ncbi:hypothetical protein GGI12_002046 [Dipsacomyces acuminosporus]|nr:hypothetical protein GGI12_002046 [Dipsacomyces acuminosporus]
MTISIPKIYSRADEKHAEAVNGMIEGDFGVKYRVLNGVSVPPHAASECYELSRTFRTRDTDACFVSYPKSGTTWLAYILVLLTRSKGATLSDSHYHFQCGISGSGYYKGSWNDWFQAFVEGTVRYGNWFDNVLSWWKHNDCENILSLK